MKINKTIALTIVKQLLENARNQEVAPSYEWYFEKALADCTERPAAFFKTEENTERFLSLLDSLQAEGQLLELA